ncbi:MAG: hypothetical protein WD023_09005 [Ilumatobacteraceae bacterium]
MVGFERHRPGVVIAVVVGLLGVGIALVTVLIATRDDPAASTASSVDPHAGHDMGPGHGGTPMPGCEGDAAAAMMMLSPSSADALLGGPCPWPYDAGISVSGGQEDSSIDAPFEPHAYQDLFDLAAAAQLGVCNVGRLPAPVTDGFVFGFIIDVRSGSCGDGPATVSIEAREQATRAWRDQNAHRAADSGAGRAMVLGRWVIVLTGDEQVVSGVSDRLVASGAVAVP